MYPSGHCHRMLFIRWHLALPQGVTPRKSEPDYARVMAHLLQQARALDTPGSSI